MLFTGLLYSYLDWDAEKIGEGNGEATNWWNGDVKDSSLIKQGTA